MESVQVDIETTEISNGFNDTDDAQLLGQVCPLLITRLARPSCCETNSPLYNDIACLLLVRDSDIEPIAASEFGQQQSRCLGVNLEFMSKARD